MLKLFGKLTLALFALLFVFSGPAVLAEDTLNGPVVAVPISVDSCAIHFTDFVMADNLKENNPLEVMKIQQFLNEYLGKDLFIGGIYDEATVEAVKEFQTMHSRYILEPWKETEATGHVYLTTRRWMNIEYCAFKGQVLSLEMPNLVAWGQNSEKGNPQLDMVSSDTLAIFEGAEVGMVAGEFDTSMEDVADGSFADLSDVEILDLDDLDFDWDEEFDFVHDDEDVRVLGTVDTEDSNRFNLTKERKPIWTLFKELRQNRE